MDEIVPEPIDLPISIQARRPPDTLGKYQDSIGKGDAVEIESLRKKYAGRTRLGQRDRRPQSSAAKEAISYVGFRRFLSLSSDPDDELFCEGLTNELVKAMRSRAGLRIAKIPVADQESTTFAGEGEKVRLNAVLVGKLRKIEERPRISVQLTNVFDGSVM